MRKSIAQQLAPLGVLAIIAAVGGLRGVRTASLEVGAGVVAERGTLEEASAQTQHQPPELMLPPPSPLSVAESLAAMRVAPGFRVDCIASEPVIEAPVWMSFDEDGRLWVVEMRSYMPDIEGTGEKLPSNRISVLEDRNGDGEFETSRVFMDGLMLPRGVMPCYGGALVLEPPSLYFCKDSDGDGRADGKDDVRINLLDGFGGIENPEHAGNGPIYGIDNWCHFSQHNTEVRFDGRGIEKRGTSGHGQWGITQDDRGRLYYTPNSNPLLMDVFPKHYGARNSNMSSVTGMGENIGQEAGTTWPIHPTPGVNRGYQDKVLREDKTLASITAACGPSIYRAGLLGEDFRGDVFICEPAGTLVKRIRMSEKNGVPRGENAYNGSEFLASTDERFRPVNTCVGPDGALYVCDMYRGVIQHKTYLTEYLKAQIRARNLETPLNMGRIYRIAPADFKPRIMPKLSVLHEEMLVELLSHKDGWYRDTAQRLLVERGAKGVERRVREMLASGEDWRVRLHALWTLDGLGLTGPDDVAAAIADDAPALRAAAVELRAYSVNALPNEELDRLVSVERDVSVRATFAAVMRDGGGGGGEAGTERMRTQLNQRTHALLHAPDAYTRDALLSSMKGVEHKLLAQVLLWGKDGELSTWPWGGADEYSRKLFATLTACIIRSGDAGKLELVEIAAVLAQTGDERADLLYKRIASEQRLEADEPKVFGLSGEPKKWLAVAADSGNSRAADFAASAIYFDWPNRPAVKRPKKMRSLTPGEQDLFAQGEMLYGKCVGCHQPEGEGAPGQAPTLVSARILLGRPDNAIKVMLHGLEGEYTYGESKYAGSMPVPAVETDREIAAVLTYCRRSFGNVAEPVKVEDVSRLRAATRGRTKAWTREELK